MEVNFKLSSTSLLNDLETNENIIFDKDKDIESEYSKKLKELENNLNGVIELKSDNKNLCLDDDNLIVKAAKKLKKISNNKKLGAKIFLKKNIPIGAGLAGGSSNAAATLIGLNKLWNLNLDYKTIHSLSTKLGSDVPFF